MEHGTSSNISRLIQAQRLAADLMELAAEHGAKHIPSITANAIGVEIYLHMQDKPTAGEVAAWQLATGGVWNIEVTRFEYEGRPVKTERAVVRFGDIPVSISVCTTGSMAVAA